jgi:coenzyme F420 hydrogenase subunit beta
MAVITIDGIRIEPQKGWTILETARFLGLDIPTLCDHEGITSWGGCRLCIVEIGEHDDAKLVSACTYPAEDGLNVRTASKRVIHTRKMILELLIARCPTSKVLQDLAVKLGLEQVRFTPRWDKCIYCGLCVRICEEQMMASAIGFIHRGNKLKIHTPFDITSEVCRRCGACIYICPACTLRCEGPQPATVLCGRCENSLQPTCIETTDDYNCWMGMKGECGTCVTLDKTNK